MIRIIAVGKKHEPWTEGGIRRYQERLRKPWDVEWVYLPHSSFEAVRARQEESGRILSRIKDDDIVLLLDERGKNVNSPALSQYLDEQLSHSQQIVVVIGGAYGVDERIQQRANFVWSLSHLVFPHQLVRLILIEQLYRAQEIARGGGYHHE